MRIKIPPHPGHLPALCKYLPWEASISWKLFFFLGLHPRLMEVPRLGVESELQLPAHTTATATRDLSRVCDLHHSSRQHQILNPLIEVRDQTHVLMDTSWVH